MIALQDWINEFERLCEEARLPVEDWPADDEDREFWRDGYSPQDRLRAWLGSADFEADGSLGAGVLHEGESPSASPISTGNAAGLRRSGHFHHLGGNRIKASRPLSHQRQVMGPATSPASAGEGLFIADKCE